MNASQSGWASRRRLPPARRVEAAAVAERLAQLVVLPGREALEHVQRVGHEDHAVIGAAEQAHGEHELVGADARDRLLRLEDGQLEPDLRGLVHGLEERLVAVQHLLGRLLQREQLVGAQVALVVAVAGPGEDGQQLAVPEHLLGRRVLDRRIVGFRHARSHPGRG